MKQHGRRSTDERKERNRVAAKKCRQKKKGYFSSLHTSISALKQQREAMQRSIRQYQHMLDHVTNEQKALRTILERHGVPHTLLSNVTTWCARTAVPEVPNPGRPFPSVTVTTATAGIGGAVPRAAPAQQQPQLVQQQKQQPQPQPPLQQLVACAWRDQESSCTGGEHPSSEERSEADELKLHLHTLPSTGGPAALVPPPIASATHGSEQPRLPATSPFFQQAQQPALEIKPLLDPDTGASTSPPPLHRTSTSQVLRALLSGSLSLEALGTLTSMGLPSAFSTKLSLGLSMSLGRALDHMDKGPEGQGGGPTSSSLECT